MINYKNYSDLNIDTTEEIYKVPSNTELIVGIPRSGMVPAYMVAAHLNLPVVSLNEFLSGHKGTTGTRKLRVDVNNIKNVLIVDDSVNTGNAISKAKDAVSHLNNSYNFKFCAIYSATEEVNFVDFYFKHLPQPRVFQWNYKNHIINTRACYDIDGVLCHDPTDEQNDDGEKYIDFILNAKPLFITSKYIPCLVTSRLEKYRKETELWLNKQKINWGELIMLDLPTAEERRRLRIHGKFKGEVFIDRHEEFFIESNWKQAKEIFRIAKKPVFCTYNDVMIKDEASITYYDNATKHAKSWNSHVESDLTGTVKKYEMLKVSNSKQENEIKDLKEQIKQIEHDPWYKFSGYNFKYRFLFLAGVVAKKTGVYKLLKPFKSKIVKEIK